MGVVIGVSSFICSPPIADVDSHSFAADCSQDWADGSDFGPTPSPNFSTVSQRDLVRIRRKLVLDCVMPNSSPRDHRPDLADRRTVLRVGGLAVLGLAGAACSNSSPSTSSSASTAPATAAASATSGTASTVATADTTA